MSVRNTNTTRQRIRQTATNNKSAPCTHSSAGDTGDPATTPRSRWRTQRAPPPHCTDLKTPRAKITGELRELHSHAKTTPTPLVMPLGNCKNSLSTLNDSNNRVKSLRTPRAPSSRRSNFKPTHQVAGKLHELLLRVETAPTNTGRAAENAKSSLTHNLDSNHVGQVDENFKRSISHESTPPPRVPKSLKSSPRSSFSPAVDSNHHGPESLRSSPRSSFSHESTPTGPKSLKSSPRSSFSPHRTTAAWEPFDVMLWTTMNTLACRRQGLNPPCSLGQDASCARWR